MINITTIEYIRDKNKEVIEEMEGKINQLTRENLELYRQIRIGKDAEKQLIKNQKELKILMTTYLGVKQWSV